MDTFVGQIFFYAILAIVLYVAGAAWVATH